MRDYEGYIQAEEYAAIWKHVGELVPRTFAEFSGPYGLGRNTYNYTDCGPCVGFVTAVPECLGFRRETVYYHDAPKDWETWRKEGRAVVALTVSSIVEGIEACTDTHTVEITEDTTEESLRREFYEAVEAVNDEAQQLWDETHGCEDCGEEDESGLIPVNPDCPTCGGSGVPI